MSEKPSSYIKVEEEDHEMKLSNILRKLYDKEIAHREREAELERLKNNPSYKREE